MESRNLQFHWHPSNLLGVFADFPLGLFVEEFLGGPDWSLLGVPWLLLVGVVAEGFFLAELPRLPFGTLLGQHDYIAPVLDGTFPLLGQLRRYGGCAF